MLSSSSVISPSPMRLSRKRAMVPSSLRLRPCQAFCPAWLTSTCPIADTSTPATFGFVAVR
jgi:hypothetical protein